MREDCLGNPIGATNPATAAAIDDFIAGYLGYDRRIVNILAAADRDPDDALANAYAGLLWMLSETGGIPEQARFYLGRSQNASLADSRARAIAEVLRHWIADDIGATLAAIEAILRDHPRDLAMLKTHQYIDFSTGDFPAMLRAAQLCQEAAAENPYLHGMLAFAYEQMHLLDHAERSARHALALAADREPWAQHALAHVMLTQGRIEEGTRFLESMRGTWGNLTSFMYTHHWWHLALFYIARGRMADALAAYDDHCWAQQKNFSQDQIGAVSLLARLDCAGVDIGPRWTELGAYLAPRESDVMQPFLTLQYLYGLARAGRPEARILRAAIEEAPHRGPRSSRKIWQEIGIPLAEGLFAHAAGEYASAIRHLAPSLGRLVDIGGSHAQRDLFEQIHLDALIRADHHRPAQQILEQRRQADPLDVPANRALAQIYAKLGLPHLAAEASARIGA